MRLLEQSQRLFQAAAWKSLVCTLATCLLASHGCSSSTNQVSTDVDLNQWLQISQVNSDEMSGFGEYPYEKLWVPSLYYTHGAVSNAKLNNLPIGEEVQIAEWIISLRREDGSFDDPSVDIPAIAETYWAIETLHLLGVDFQRICWTRTFIESELSKLKIQSPTADEELVSALFDAVSLIKSSRILADAGLPVGTAACDDLIEQLLSVKPIRQSRTPAPDVWGADEISKSIWAHTLSLALLAPAKLDNYQRNYLTAHLDAIAEAPSHFVVCERIHDLLTACIAVFEWTDMPNDIADMVFSYLNLSILPILSSSGGFGWVGEEDTTWIDPQMTLPVIRLYNGIGQLYPLADAFAATIAKYRVSAGWLYQVQVSRSPSLTYFAHSIAQSINSQELDKQRLRQYYERSLEDTNESLAEVLYASLGLAQIAGDIEEVREPLYARIQSSDISWLAARTDSLVTLMYEFGIRPWAEHVRDLLLDYRDQILERLSVSMRVDAVWQLLQLDSLLGSTSLSEGEVVAFTCDQEVASGGFRVSPDLPAEFADVADLLTTYRALRILEFSERLDLVSRRSLSVFLSNCRYGLGYLLAPEETLLRIGDSLDVDLLSTHYGLIIQTFLDTGILLRPAV